MESILSIHDEVYPLKPQRNKSSVHVTDTTTIKINSLNNQTNIFLLYYQYIKIMVAHRSLYILGVLNLILAAVAIVCVTQAEDHPEYFSLVYIAVSIFIFYMGTIIFIIVLQFIETYREQHERNRSLSVIQMPLLTPQITTQLNPTIVESMTTKTQTKTRLSRSQTLPLTLTSSNPHHTLSTSSSSAIKDPHPMISTRLVLLPKYHQSIVNPPRNYQSFGLTTNDQLYPSSSTIVNGDDNSPLSSLITPIPLKSHVNSSINKSKN